MYEINLSTTHVFCRSDFCRPECTNGHDQKTKRITGRSDLGVKTADSFHVHVQQRRHRSRKRNRFE